MPALILSDYDKKSKNTVIAVCKGDNAKNQNKLLYLDRDLKRKGDVHVNSPDGMFFNIAPSTDPDKREIIYICGPSGSGKSYIAKCYGEMYQKLYPDRKVYLVSKLEQDDTIDSMEPQAERIDIYELMQTWNINSYNNCLFIMDDYDTFGKEEGKFLLNVIEDICTMGRKHTEDQGAISMLLLTHRLTNYSKTRNIFLECTGFIIYPMMTNYYSLNYLLKKYLGLDDETVKNLRQMGSRWVYISQGMYPNYMLSEHEAKLLLN